VSRFCLRYASEDIELSVGDFTLGRAADCRLLLRDALVSRRHAVLHVEESRVLVEDLSSRNGVLVNGAKIKGPVELRHGDRIAIGGQELYLRDTTRTRLDALATMPGVSLYATQETDAYHPPQQNPNADTLEDEPDDTVSLSAHVLLVDVVSKAIALGRHAEAQRVLKTLLSELSTLMGRGDKIRPETIRAVGRSSCKLAEHTRSPDWIDHALELHTATGVLMDNETIEALHGAVRKVRYQGVAIFRAYLEAMQTRAHSFTTHERFLLKRLQGLAAVVGA